MAGEDVDRRIRAPGATPPLTVGLDAAPEWARVVQGTATEDPRLQGKAPASANGLVAVRVTDADGRKGKVRTWVRVTDVLPLRFVLPERIQGVPGRPIPRLFAQPVGERGPYTVAVDSPTPLPRVIEWHADTREIGGVFPPAGTLFLRLSVTDSVGNKAYASVAVVSANIATPLSCAFIPGAWVFRSGSSGSFDLGSIFTVSGAPNGYSFAVDHLPSWMRFTVFPNMSWDMHGVENPDTSVVTLTVTRLADGTTATCTATPTVT